MRELLSKHVAPWLGVIVESIAKAQADGSMRADIDPEAYVLQVIHLVVGTFTTGLTLQTLLGNGHKRREAPSIAGSSTSSSASRAWPS